LFVTKKWAIKLKQLCSEVHFMMKAFRQLTNFIVKEYFKPERGR
jgi:hypothetical protein